MLKTFKIKTEFSEKDIESVRKESVIKAKDRLKKIKAEIADYEDKYPELGEENGDKRQKMEKSVDIAPGKKSDFESMRDIVERLEDVNYREFIKAFVSVERGIRDEKVLDDIFDGYIRHGTLEGLDDSEKIPEIPAQDYVEVAGNLTGNAILKHLKGNNGKDFDVVNFSVCTNKEDGTKMFTGIAVFGNQIADAASLKKGDFVSISGNLTLKEGRDGKTYRNIKAKDVKLLKAKNQRRESALEKIEKYKSEIKKSRDISGDKIDRNPDGGR